MGPARRERDRPAGPQLAAHLLDARGDRAGNGPEFDRAHVGRVVAAADGEPRAGRLAQRADNRGLDVPGHEIDVNREYAARGRIGVELGDEVQAVVDDRRRPAADLPSEAMAPTRQPVEKRKT